MLVDNSTLVFPACGVHSLLGKWLGPGGSDPHGYAVFMEVVDGWEVVEAIVARKTSSNPNPPSIPIIRTYVY